MIKRFYSKFTGVRGLDHIAIAISTKDRCSHLHFYENILMANISARTEQKEHGVYTTFIDLANNGHGKQPTKTTKIELLEVLGESSPISKFLEKNPSGGIHHVCYLVDNIHDAIEHFKKNNIRILGDGKAKIGAHGKPVIFLHPKDCNGILTEIEQI